MALLISIGSNRPQHYDGDDSSTYATRHNYASASDCWPRSAKHASYITWVYQNLARERGNKYTPPPRPSVRPAPPMRRAVIHANELTACWRRARCHLYRRRQGVRIDTFYPYLYIKNARNRSPTSRPVWQPDRR